MAPCANLRLLNSNESEARVFISPGWGILFARIYLMEVKSFMAASTLV